MNSIRLWTHSQSSQHANDCLEFILLRRGYLYKQVLLHMLRWFRLGQTTVSNEELHRLLPDVPHRALRSALTRLREEHMIVRTGHAQHRLNAQVVLLFRADDTAADQPDRDYVYIELLDEEPDSVSPRGRGSALPVLFLNQLALAEAAPLDLLLQLRTPVPPATVYHDYPTLYERYGA